ncbi:MAG: lipopolysaccharide heptosyltransferase II [Pirellulaceae bacterium]
MRIGVFLPNWIGDVVMATPALRSLRRQVGPDALLVGIARPYVADVLAGTDWLDALIQYDRHSLWGLRQLIARLRRERFDAILLLTNSFSTGVFARLAGARQRVGFSLHGRRWLLTDPLDEPRHGSGRTPRSAVDHYLDVVHVLGGRTDSRMLELATMPQEEQAADRVWQEFGWTRRDPIIALNTGGAYGSAKRWPGEHYASLARCLADRQQHVLILCGPSERDSVRDIGRRADRPHVRTLADQKLNLGLIKACVRRSRLMVTTDSGPRHIAAAFGVPTVTLFGPTDPRWSHNYHPAAAELYLTLPCRPCGCRVCPLKHHRCMRELAVEDVLAATITLLHAHIDDRAA